ncbi:MAG: hypothetical protein KF878_12740 [Planctomycetes bacterium]|nr:hypothetical protein [Planctomycetota bacterium]
MSSTRRTNRRGVKLAAIAAAGGAALALSVAVLLPSHDDERRDPTRRGPARHLRLTDARVIESPSGARLRVRAETNLVPGAVVAVLVLAGAEEVVRLEGVSDGAQVAVDAQASGAVVAGAYQVLARFRLEEQPAAVREALSYQPAHLSDRSALELPLRLSQGREAQEELRALVDALNRRPGDAAVLDEVDRRAEALLAGQWISGQRPALQRLRLAVEVARRPDFRRDDFDRLLLEAHVLGGS